MTREKKRLTLPLIVEGRYDKCTLSSLFSGMIVSLDGFSVFNSKEKQSLLRRISDRGIIVLTDSDGGGRQLRSFVSGLLPKDKVFHLYIPKIEGKEKRKQKRSKEGYLGVEGMKPELLLKILSPFTEDGGRVEKNDKKEVTPLDFYSDGFTGKDSSRLKRRELAHYLGLPEDMTAKALLAAINLVSSYEEYRVFCENNSLQNTEEI